MNPRSPLRRPGQEPRRAGAESRGPAPPELVLYKCPPLAAWLTATACTRLKLSLQASTPRRGTARDWRPLPCFGCPGVVELHAQGATPAPRRVAT